MSRGSLVVEASLVFLAVLSQTDEESAFWLCLRLQLHHNMQCLYSHEHPFLTEYLKLFYLYCQQYVPALMEHFKEQQYFVTMFAVEVRAVFVLNCCVPGCFKGVS
jgi:hypothetical protein